MPVESPPSQPRFWWYSHILTAILAIVSSGTVGVFVYWLHQRDKDPLHADEVVTMIFAYSLPWILFAIAFGVSVGCVGGWFAAIRQLYQFRDVRGKIDKWTSDYKRLKDASEAGDFLTATMVDTSKVSVSNGTATIRLMIHNQDPFDLRFGNVDGAIDIARKPGMGHANPNKIRVTFAYVKHEHIEAYRSGDVAARQIFIEGSWVVSDPPERLTTFSISNLTVKILNEAGTQTGTVSIFGSARKPAELTGHILVNPD